MEPSRAPSCFIVQRAWIAAGFRPIASTAGFCTRPIKPGTTSRPPSARSAARSTSFRWARSRQNMFVSPSMATSSAGEALPSDRGPARGASPCTTRQIRPCVLSRKGVMYAPRRPVSKPAGVGLCWTMKLYQSITHTWPSGPTSAWIGAVHSSSLATRFQPIRLVKPAPFGDSSKLATMWPVGSQTNPVRFQYSSG